MYPGDDPKTSSTYLVTFVGGILVLAVVIVGQVVTYNVQRFEDERKLLAPKPAALADLQAQQMAQISGYRLLNPQTGVVAIPIDRAIELYVDELKTGRGPTTMRATTERSVGTQPSGKTE